MNAQQEIKDAQKEWAESKCQTFYSSRYPYHLDHVGANLRQCLSARALDGYANGDGLELRDTRRGPAKMKALRSSSVLAANFFDYWTDKEDKTSLLRVLDFRDGRAESLDFEAKFHTEISKKGQGNPPNLDVAITLSSCHVIAIEGKFTEPFSRSTNGSKSSFKDAYFPHSRELWRDKDLLACQLFARELQDGLHRFEYLDVAQLLKHALGLATQLGKGKFSLYYLYYDWSGESNEARKRSKTHKDEIDVFSDRVRKELCFKALTYQEVYKQLRESDPPDEEYADYLCYLGERYFSGKGAPK